jgi:DMSO/TMAO reductase YedYZ molybdopterin-dependent catalytic subunit
MSLFIVRHDHDSDRCPAADPLVGASLLNHLSRPNLRDHGIEIRGEAVVQGQHAMFMILEAEDEEHLRTFLAPFAQAGTIEVLPASTCVRVVASGGCAGEPPALEPETALDPEEACEHAIEAGLLVHRAHPLNGETSIAALLGGVVMPNAQFYVRNHFQIPRLDPATWQLSVHGLVDRPLRLSLRDLHNMPSQTSVVTLECAGNGRYTVDPPAPGEQWHLGAVSTAEWTGVPLAEVLDRCGVQPGACEVLFRGADGGRVDDRPDEIAFERSLRVDVARDANALLAYAMNGEAIPAHHGFPVRVVVPDWYGVASVKWLTDIELIGSPFAGYYQFDKYQYEWSRNGGVEREPVTLQKVRALITEPSDNGVITSGELAVRGVAWSGAATIERVDVSVDGGPWQEARLIGDRQRHSWQWWELLTRVTDPGPISLRARATDLAGRTQPDVAPWNPHGYGNNAIQEVRVTCAP